MTDLFETQIASELQLQGPQVGAIRDRLAQLRELSQRSGVILSSLEEQGVLTDELRDKVDTAARLTDDTRPGAPVGTQPIPTCMCCPWTGSNSPHTVRPSCRAHTHPCWPPSPPPPFRGRWPTRARRTARAQAPERFPAGHPLRPCVLPRAASPCTQRPASRRPTAPASKACADTTTDRHSPQGAGTSSTASTSHSPSFAFPVPHKRG